MAASKTFEQKILYYGTQAEYAAAEKSDSRLYFTSDTNKLYKGSVDFSAAVRVATGSDFPASGAANNVLYVVKNDGAFVKAGYTENGGTSWTTVAFATVGSAATLVEGYTGDEVSVPTTKALVDYVASKVGSSGAVTSISATESAATLQYAVAGSTVTTDVTVPGVVSNPQWDSSDWTLSMDVSAIGSTASTTFSVEFGKHLVIESGRYDSSAQEIVLVLANAEQSEIRIDVSDLIDEITGGTTDTAVTTYDAATNTLTADVRVSAKAGNYLKTVTGDSTAANNGLMVDLSTIVADIATAEDNIDALYTSLGTWHAIATA